MKNYKKALFLTVLLSMVAIVFAQADNSSQSIFMTGTQSGLLNPFKLKMSHSIGFSAGVSSDKSGYYFSRYTNHLKYSFNPKLDLDVDLHFFNFGSSKVNGFESVQFNDDNKSRILPEFSLNYKPSDSITIQLQYRKFAQHPFFRHGMNFLEQ